MNHDFKLHDLEVHLHEAEKKAWESLARYKFQMFGYWAAIWVHLNRLGDFHYPNPWRELVSQARRHPKHKHHEQKTQDKAPLAAGQAAPTTP